MNSSVPFWRNPPFVIGAIAVPIVAALLGALLIVLVPKLIDGRRPQVTNIRPTTQVATGSQFDVVGVNLDLVSEMLLRKGVTEVSLVPIHQGNAVLTVQIPPDLDSDVYNLMIRTNKGDAVATEIMIDVVADFVVERTPTPSSSVGGGGPPTPTPTPISTDTPIPTSISTNAPTPTTVPTLDLNPVLCPDPADPRSINEQLTRCGWDALNIQEYELSMNISEECIDTFEIQALREQEKFTASGSPSPPVGRVSEDQKNEILSRGVLNDVATCYFINGRSAEGLSLIT